MLAMTELTSANTVQVQTNFISTIVHLKIFYITVHANYNKINLCVNTNTNSWFINNNDNCYNDNK